ncbi:MAG: ribbon-helix-helix domain-containing protein [Pseudomonadota bacterium]
MARPGDGAVRKRSVSLRGHRTSVSLEDAFWEALQDLARAEGETLSALIARIDEARGDASLSSALRVHALGAFREMADR